MLLLCAVVIRAGQCVSISAYLPIKRFGISSIKSFRDTKEISNCFSNKPSSCAARDYQRDDQK